MEVSSRRYLVRIFLLSVPEITGSYRKFYNGRGNYNQGILGSVRDQLETFYDKGLFDARELGYIY
jgi:hypothetical protein